MALTIWIDVEDLFEYAVRNPRPSGIQRIEYELCHALATLPESREMVRFVRHDAARQSFYTVPWAQLDRLFGTLISAAASQRQPAVSARPPNGASARGGLRAILQRGAYRLPPDVRTALIDFRVHQTIALRHLRASLLAIARARPDAQNAARQSDPDGAPPDAPADTFRSSVSAGDLLVVLGAPWSHPAYAAIVERARREFGVRFALLVYDIIPLRRPEWCDRRLIGLFRAWLHGVLPLADIVLTISDASAADLVRYAARAGLSMRTEPRTIPIGTGFRNASARDAGEPARLPPAGSYALVVSTIEARKNHALLFRVWRQLLEDMPAETVPTLVFAGRVGWLVADLMQQLRNSNFLEGKILLIEDPTDADLERLYRGCLFTLFPSFYEGWGLPVSESLSFGRPCVISDATSLPEAGGSLARYFDPGNATEAYRVIRATIENHADRQLWQERIAREFTPVPWDASARAVLRALGAACPFGTPLPRA